MAIKKKIQQRSESNTLIHNSNKRKEFSIVIVAKIREDIMVDLTHPGEFWIKNQFTHLKQTSNILFK